MESLRSPPAENLWMLRQNQFHHIRVVHPQSTLDCLRLVWPIHARVSARAKSSRRQEKGVKAIHIIPRSRRLDAK
jgi:hypothetical protein